MIELVAVFVGLLFSHYIADAHLQPPAMSSGKRSADSETRLRWLFAHGAVHGFVVALFLPFPFPLLELWSHVAIDRGKGKGWYGTKTDQTLHVLCKVLWLALLPVYMRLTR